MTASPPAATIRSHVLGSGRKPAWSYSSFSPHSVVHLMVFTTRSVSGSHSWYPRSPWPAGDSPVAMVARLTVVVVGKGASIVAVRAASSGTAAGWASCWSPSPSKSTRR